MGYDKPMERRYFDWAATAIPSYSMPSSIPFGNPSSKYREGREAKAALEEARARCAAVLEVAPETLYFTSGGSESNAIVLNSLLLRKGDPALIISAIEHPSIREQIPVLRRLGKRIVSLPPETDGRVSGERLSEILGKAENPRFAAIMAVNNETGALMDMETLGGILRSRGGAPVHFHCDMVQALGKIPLDLAAWDIDSAAFSAHKIGGPRGIGLLYLKKPLEVLNTGGGQEGGIRPGTENLAGILAFTECAERQARRDMVKGEYKKAAGRMDRLIRGIREIPGASPLPSCRNEGDGRYSPYILQASFKGIPGEVMVRALDDAGFAVSTGSACSSASLKRPVLEAMGIGEQEALQGVRFSQGQETRDEDIEKLLAAIKEIVRRFS
ncbi:cysteine desulfurase [Treponema sp. OttesenSCG-928-L16]|nr:cysteine desulfurase [Treponema sp. OttesenSCG-928-L16]